jgi:tRNA-uridine 2-sulfurtransferase
MSASAELDDVSLAEGLELPLSAEVQVRYRGAPLPARIVKAPGGARVLFEKPVQAVVPGQFAVFYAGTRVLGGGLIRKAEQVEVAAAAAAELSP